MKRIFLAAATALIVSAGANAQSTVDSIRAKYQLQAMPAPLTMEKTFPVVGSYQLTNVADAGMGTVTVSLDAANKGVIWVEGLPEGKIKAYLKKGPSTYRILPQKSESGKQIPEGTLVYDPSANVLNIALGKAYDDTDPNAVFTLNSVSNNTAEGSNTVEVKKKTPTSKTKTKITFYTANKSMPQGDMNNNMMNNNMTTPQQDSTHTQQ